MHQGIKVCARKRLPPIHQSDVPEPTITFGVEEMERINMRSRHVISMMITMFDSMQWSGDSREKSFHDVRDAFAMALDIWVMKGNEAFPPQKSTS